MRTPPPESHGVPPTYQRAGYHGGGHDEPAWMREDAQLHMPPGVGGAVGGSLPPTAGSSLLGETTPLRGMCMCVWR